MGAVALTVLGCSGTHAGRGQMCSSYLLEHDGYRLLLDCGNGSLANLQRCVDVSDLDAVVLSHLHPDHFADLYGLYYALRFHPGGPASVPVYAPAGAGAFIGQLLGSQETFLRTCAFSEVAAGQRLMLGPLHVELFAADHPVETLASRIDADGTVVAFSGDSGPTATLVDCARDADLFLCDATWLGRDGPHPEGVHMTGTQAGALASEAATARLLLTHIYPRTDRDALAAEAADAYDGDVLVACDLQEHLL